MALVGCPERTARPWKKNRSGTFSTFTQHFLNIFLIIMTKTFFVSYRHEQSQLREDRSWQDRDRSAILKQNRTLTKVQLSTTFFQHFFVFFVDMCCLKFCDVGVVPVRKARATRGTESYQGGRGTRQRLKQETTTSNIFYQPLKTYNVKLFFVCTYVLCFCMNRRQKSKVRLRYSGQRY